MANPAQLLGFAFANADLLFEIDQDTTVVFATGAISEFVRAKDPELVGRGAARLFEPSDGVKFVTWARALREGGRAGPLRLKLAGGKEACVALCRLPQNNGHVSCTLAHPGQRQDFGASTTDARTGLATKDEFLTAASKIADGAALMLVDVPGLPDACAKLSDADADRLMKRIGEVVQAAGTKAAGRVSGTIFGAISDAGKKTKLADSIRAVLKEGGLDTARVADTLVQMSGGGLSPEQRMLAVRHVVSRFAEGKHDIKPGTDLVALFDDMIGETQNRALALTDVVLSGNFSLVYQPIIELATGALSHCEALARFEGPDGTGETVAFAEALGISDAFDVAVTTKALQQAAGSKSTHLAFNLSGATLCSPSTFGLIAGLLATKRNLAPRVKIEVTETSQVGDLATANQAIQALRAMGFKVGLDDFGAGAASFQYLHAFDVDFVKFDSALIHRLGQAPREDMLVSGLVKLCRELGVQTVAEGIETAEQMKRVRAIGFDLGQGYYVGKPSAELRAPAPAPASHSARRKGEQLSWG